MNQKFLFSLVFLFLCKALFSQSGFKVSSKTDKAYEKTPLLKLENIKSFDKEIFTLRPYAPIPLDQKGTSACVPISIYYSASTISLAIQNNWKGEKYRHRRNQLALSGIFVYAQMANTDSLCLQKFEFSRVFNFSKDTGICNISAYNLNNYDELEEPCFKRTNNDWLSNKKYRITERKLFEKNETKPDTIINFFQKCLFVGRKPIIVGLKLYSNYINDISEKTNSKINLKPSNNKEYHAVTIIGFKKDKRTNSFLFEIMDSRGTSKGDEGFWWITEKDLLATLIYAYTLEIRPEYEYLRTTFDILDARNDKIVDPLLYFDEDKHLYQVRKNAWNLESSNQIMIRPTIKNMQKGSYIYMLYFDAQKQKYIHYKNIEGHAMVHKDIISLQMTDWEKVDNEYFVYMYSYKKLKIENILKKLNVKPSKDSIYEDFKTILGKDLKDVTYEKDNIAIQEKSLNGNIVPIIIKLIEYKEED